MLKRVCLAIIAVAAFASHSFAACSVVGSVYTATTVADLQACFTAADLVANAEIHYSGNGTVSTQLTYNPGAGSFLHGDGSTSIVGGNDITSLSDQQTGSQPILSITTVAGTFRIYGITFKGGTLAAGNDKYDGIVRIGGASTDIRVDHSHFDVTTYNNTEASSGIQFIGCTAGVLDHILWNANAGSQNNAIRAFNQGSCNSDALGLGDQSWTFATSPGASSVSKTIYVEDSVFYNGAANDCVYGGRAVLRFNVLYTSTGAPTFQTHPTIDRERGCRAMEIYNNQMNAQDGYYIADGVWISSGPAFVWNNTAPGSHTATYQGYSNFLHLLDMRKDNGTNYTQSPPPAKWGYCGPAYHTGTVTTSGATVTKTGGDNFSTSWPSGSAIIINGSTFLISNVASTTSLTVSSGSPTNGTYVTGSNWDSNSDVNTGYPCLDQPGRGQGDLLVNDFPNVANSSNGGAIYTSPNAWPRQALEPVYEFIDTWNAVPNNPGHLLALAGNVLTENVDVYVDNSGCVGGGACTSGVGHGTSLPTSCTVNVGFWKTNEGSWNDGSNMYYTGQGVFYKCTGTNSWTLTYTPETYPHPLINSVCTPAKLAFTSQPVSATLGNSLGTVQVSVEDANGVVCTSDTSSVTLSKDAGATWGTLTSATSLTKAAVAGVATWTDLSVITTSGSGKIDAQDGALSGAASTSFTIADLPPSVPGAFRLRLNRR